VSARIQRVENKNGNSVGETLLLKIEQLERENAALRADKERLDWLEQLYEWPTHHDGEWHCFAGTFKTLRDAIDAEKKEAQP